MKNYIDFSFNVVSEAIQKKFIHQEYKENIVFQWLKRPCLIRGKNLKVLSQESLFYICFRLLDTLKQCNDLTDCQVQSEMQCVPYEIERLIPESIYDNSYYCASERMFAIFTLHTLLCMLETDEAATLARYLEQDTEYLMRKTLLEQWYFSIYNDIMNTLTKESPIYQRSAQIMQSTDYCETNETHLIDYVQKYMLSPQRISEEIANLSALSHSEGDHHIGQTEKNNKEIEQLQTRIKTLEESLQKKDEKIAALREEIETSSKPAEGYIQIESSCKSKVAAILSAMYYANYFHGVNLSDKDQAVTHILKHGFNYSTKSEPQLVSTYVRNGGNLENLKHDLQNTITLQLDDALNNLTCIQKVRTKKDGSN